MAMNARRLLVAAALLGGATLVGASPPAQADYVPFTIVDPTEGPPGTVITATGDTWCATTTQEPGENIQPGVPGSVVVEFGLLRSWPPDLGTEDQFEEVLVTTDATVGADGRWSAQITVPEGTPPGDRYGVLGRCTVEYTPEETTTTVPVTTEPSTSTTVVPDADAPAPGAAGDTLSFLFFPAQFVVTEDSVPATTTVPAGAAPANAVPGQATFTG
jgi:hypothetical protein